MFVKAFAFSFLAFRPIYAFSTNPRTHSGRPRKRRLSDVVNVDCSQQLGGALSILVETLGHGRFREIKSGVRAGT
jgi:hypothetical protein